MNPAVPLHTEAFATHQWPVLQAPSHWRDIDFISDLHLQASELATFEAWEAYLNSTCANAVFILGDLFEVWIGDDVLTSHPPSAFEQQCAAVLKKASGRLDIFFIHGNRDFLLGPGFAQASGVTLLNDPSILSFAGERFLLSHGDALCLADTDYQAFRKKVRSASWQKSFLAQTLSQREAIARSIRTESEILKGEKFDYADLDEEATCLWLHSSLASKLIHGHTHKPGEHAVGGGNLKKMSRFVLSDWDADAHPPRIEILRMSMPKQTKAQRCVLKRIPASNAGRTV